MSERYAYNDYEPGTRGHSAKTVFGYPDDEDELEPEPDETMTPDEKLQRIRARCGELLAIAEKRTPGKWRADNNEVIELFRGHLPNQLAVLDEDNDAHFIAACAGAAEAGWRSTIAAIDHVKLHNFTNGDIERAILAAWPDELL